MAITVKKSSAFAAAALAAGFSMLPLADAEAQWRGRPGGWHGGPARHHHVAPRHRGIHPGVVAGIAGAAILGGALLARPAYGAPVYGTPVYDEPADCYIVRRKIWDEYRGRWVNVRQQVCD